MHRRRDVDVDLSDRRRPRGQQWAQPPTDSRNPDSLEFALFALAAAALAQPRAALASAAALA